jgi:hypothetical protein
MQLRCLGELHGEARIHGLPRCAGCVKALLSVGHRLPQTMPNRQLHVARGLCQRLVCCDEHGSGIANQARKVTCLQAEQLEGVREVKIVAFSQFTSVRKHVAICEVEVVDL